MSYTMLVAYIVDRNNVLKCACPYVPKGVLYVAYVLLICAML